MKTHDQVICGDCGHTESLPLGARADVYFPARRVYAPGAAMPWQCPVCANSQDVVLFGENEIQAAMRLDQSILRLPHVQASNAAYAAQKRAPEPGPAYSTRDRICYPPLGFYRHRSYGAWGRQQKSSRPVTNH